MVASQLARICRIWEQFAIEIIITSFSSVLEYVNMENEIEHGGAINYMSQLTIDCIFKVFSSVIKWNELAKGSPGGKRSLITAADICSSIRNHSQNDKGYIFT